MMLLGERHFFLKETWIFCICERARLRYFYFSKRRNLRARATVSDSDLIPTAGGRQSCMMDV